MVNEKVYRTLIILCSLIQCSLCIDCFYFKENTDAHINFSLRIAPTYSYYVQLYDENNKEIFRVQGTVYQAFGSYINRIDFHGDTRKRDMTLTLKNATSNDAGYYRAHYRYTSGKYTANDFFYLANGTIVYAVEKSDAMLYWDFASHTNITYSVVYNPEKMVIYRLLQPHRDDASCASFGCFRRCLYEKYTERNGTYTNGYMHVTFIVKETTTMDAGMYFSYSYTHVAPYKTTTAGTKLVVYSSYCYAEENAIAILRWNTTHTGNDYIINQSEEEILFIQNNEVNRSVSERFDFTGNITDGYIELKIEQVTSADEGIYSVHFGSTGARLVVYVPPEKPLIVPDSELIPRSSVTLKCISKSNTVPAGAPPIPMYYTWFVDNRKITNDFNYKVVSSRLTIINTEIEDLGHKFTCQAEEVSSKPSAVSSAYNLNMKFPPLAFIKPPNTSYAKSEGDQFYDVTCFAKCSPECKYVWMTPSGVTIFGPTLSLGNLNRKQHGTYTCTASNEIGEDTKEIYVNVQYYITIQASTASGFSTTAISMIAVGGTLILVAICAVVVMKCRTAAIQARKQNCYETQLPDIKSEENKDEEKDVYDNLNFRDPVLQVEYDEIDAQEPKQNNVDEDDVYENPPESPSDGYEPVPPLKNFKAKNVPMK